MGELYLFTVNWEGPVCPSSQTDCQMYFDQNDSSSCGFGLRGLNVVVLLQMKPKRINFPGREALCKKVLSITIYRAHEDF